MTEQIALGQERTEYIVEVESEPQISVEVTRMIASPRSSILGKIWAPEVTELAPGAYATYFTATNFSPAVQCIGVATSGSLWGHSTRRWLSS